MKIGGNTAGHQSRGGVEDDDIAMGSGFHCEDGPGRLSFLPHSPQGDAMVVDGRVYGLCGMACAVLAAAMVPPRARHDSLQGHWVIDDRSSLAWWQINPHLGDLWGTTCPQESSWHAGREQDPYKRTTTAYAAVLDTVIPLYPRPVAQAVRDLMAREPKPE